MTVINKGHIKKLESLILYRGTQRRKSEMWMRGVKTEKVKSETESDVGRRGNEHNDKLKNAHRADDCGHYCAFQF